MSGICSFLGNCLASGEVWRSDCLLCYITFGQSQNGLNLHIHPGSRIYGESASYR
jgi:hypothetical protein